eukprot:CAMPEP_0119044252 /NCGR_PEP_ID=MMETSP1177-20130426/29949_1 /TAXON_ID=2985 /ORGANISM="Ochromonas sp, Strain CCMP1899" /LENGTH=566 /DNA_ID=CAMNT_0007014065 /DNA_START=229 /DNA_END=1929 /DNA_ORIENTATION=+
MGIDVSGLTIGPMPEEVVDILSASTTEVQWSDLSNALIITGGLAYFAYEKRPRGSARDDLMEVKDSQVPGANLGCFAKKFIPKGTVLGRYPGFLRNMEEALASKENDDARKGAQSYMFSVDENLVIDPSNTQGAMENQITFLGVIKIETMIARINEPPMGGDVNVYTKIFGNGVTVMAERDIFPKEELFMDYGDTYNREGYAEEAAGREIEQNKVLEEEEARKLLQNKPIVSEYDRSDEEIMDEFVELKGGFLQKLNKASEGRFKDAGILSPDEAEDLFKNMGQEGRELVINKNIKREEAKKSSSSMSDDFGRNTIDEGDNEGDDEDLMKSLEKQMGADNMKDFANVPDILSGTKIPKNIPKEEVKKVVKKTEKSETETISASSIFDSLIGDGSGPGVEMEVEFDKEKSSKGILGEGGQGFGQKKGELTDAPLYTKALSQKESEQLLSSLDTMSDEEVAAVLGKLRTGVSERIQDEVSDALFADALSKNKKEINENIQKELKKMPRAPSVDPEIRKKYGKELDAIEEELERIYSDPLGVWQELMKNPEKFLKENEIGGLGEDEELQ